MFEVMIGHKFDSNGIYYNAKYSWNALSSEEKQKKGNKYSKSDSIAQYIKDCEWNVEFDELNEKQKILLMKSILIKTYDSLSNNIKTEIMKEYGLSKFSSKWFRMPKNDRSTICSKVLLIPNNDSVLNFIYENFFNSIKK